jgi:7-cyano-7-deazaguanine synthase
MSTGLLLSGGMDSAALAYWKRPKFAYTVDYGQLPADGEIRAAAALCEALSIQHRIVRADCSGLGTGDLAGRSPSPLAPITEWWPYRNQLIITLAGAAALSDGVNELMIGAIQSDHQHADGRPEFFESLSRLMQLQEGALKISVPAIGLSAVELVKTSGIPFSMLAWSHSCHVAGYACGQCRGCTKHAETMKELGYGDY